MFQDGTIDKNDLRGAFDNVGVLMTEVSFRILIVIIIIRVIMMI